MLLLEEVLESKRLVSLTISGDGPVWYTSAVFWVALIDLHDLQSKVEKRWFVTFGSKSRRIVAAKLQGVALSILISFKLWYCNLLIMLGQFQLKAQTPHDQTGCCVETLNHLTPEVRLFLKHGIQERPYLCRGHDR